MSNPTRPNASTRPATNSPAVDTDAELMNQLTVAGGRNNRPLEKLGVRYERLIMNALRRWNIRPCDCDELFNSVLIALWELARDGKWDEQKARHRSDAFLPLLSKIIHSKAIDFHRKTRRRNERMNTVADAMAAFGGDWQSQLASASSTRARCNAAVPPGVPQGLEGAVAAVPETFRRVFILHAEGNSNRVIATKVGCSPGEVSRRLSRARAILRKSVDRDR